MSEETVPSKLKTLEELYKNIESSESPRPFFINLFKYVQTIDNDPSFSNLLLEEVIKVGRKEQDPLRKAEVRAEKIMDSLYKKVVKQIVDCGIDDKGVNYRVTDYEGYLKGTTKSSAGRVKGRTGSLVGLLSSLLNHEDTRLSSIAKPYAVYDKDNHFSRWSFIKEIEQLSILEGELNRAKQLSSWYHWDQLANAYNIYTEVTEYKNKAFKNGEYLTLGWLFEAEQELELYMKDKLPEKQVTVFDYKELRTNIQLFHFEFKQILALYSTNDIKIRPEKSVTFIQSTGELQLRGKTTFFSDSKFTYYALNQLLHIKGKKQVNRGEDLVEFEGTDVTGDAVDTKRKEKRFYNNFYNANKQIKLDTGCENFFIFNSTTCRINPKYLL